MPGIDLPSGIKTLNPVPVEFWSGPYTGADETAAKLAANTAIPSAVRFLTMEVSLIIAGIGYKYWYKDGIADLDLVKVDTDISNLVTLNTNQTITGEKTFNGGDLKLQGYDNVNAVSLTYVPGVGTGTVVFPDASGGTAKTIAYRDWVTSQGYITSNAVNSVNGQTGVVVLTTTNISEGSNLYYTSTRANNDFDTRLATKTTSDLTEGTNLYYTNTRFNTDFASKTTTDLGEGSNLYFTNARAIGATLTGYTSGAGTISSADSILQAIQKLNGNIAGLVTGVSSVFGRTGIVTATSGDYNTSQITENTNLYFTDDRARAALSLTTTGTSGAATYNDITGVLNIPEYQGGVTSFNTRTGAITLTSTDVTDALTFTPYNASNPNNYIPLTALSSSATGLTYTNTTGVFSLTSGYVIPTTTQETDWNTAYTNRITSLTTTGASGAATLISNVLNIPEYTLAGLGGVPTTRTLTIGQGGSATDLSADRTFLSNVPNVDATNASNISSGTLADARLSSNVPLKNTANTFTENQTISKSNPQVELVSATTAKASLLRGETTNTFSLTNDVLEVGGTSSNCVFANSSTQSVSSSPTSITGLTQWSVSFWFFANSGITNQNLIYFGDGTNAYRIRHAANIYINFWYNGVQQGTATVGSNYGVWNHVTITKDAGNTLRYYFNGNLISTTTTSNISTINIFRIGNSADLPFGDAGMDWNTRYDQVLFYNTALTLANVQTIYAGGTGTTSLPSTGNLLLRYELNEGTGTTTVNQGSASNGNGTLLNGMLWGIANGRIPTEAAIQLGTAINIRDGVLNGERGQYRFGDPFGGTIIRGRSIKFQAPLETNFSFIHNGTSTLIDPSNTNTSATGASTVSVVGNASIGANVAAPTNGLQVAGETKLTGLNTAITTKTADYTALTTDHTILVDATSNNVTITLPTAVGNSRLYTIKRIDGSVNTVTIATTSSQTIDGSTTYTGLLTQYQTVAVQSNSSHYFITAKF